MAEKQKNQIIVLEPVTKTVNELLEMITERDQAEIMPFMSADEAVQCTRQFVPCMFVVCIQTNQDIPNVLAVLKKLKPDIKQGLVKTLLVSKVKNPQLQKLIGEFGVTDYIEEPITTRSLQFKANLQLRAVDNTRKQIELKKKADEKIVFKTSAGGADDTAQTLNGDVKPRNKPALQLASDTFLLKASPVKKQAKKFLVELDGPDPSTGEWVADGEDPKNPNWRWKPNEKEDEPGAGEGDGWVATGDKPQFKPANKKWQLSSEKPGLFYKKKNSKIAEKISTDENGEIAVADDSPMAEENLRKNLAKVERTKKRKAAEAAGLPPPEEEPEPEAAAEAAAEEPEEEEEEEGKGANAILQALRKKKLAKKKAAEAAAGAAGPAEAESEAGGDDSPARKKLEQLRRARKERAAKGLAPEELPEEEAEEPKAAAPAGETETGEEAESPSLRAQKRKKAKAEKPEANVLDFLQKKKEERKKESSAEEEPAEASAQAEAGPEEESSRTAELLKKARERRAKAKAASRPEEEIAAEGAAEPKAEDEPEAEEEPGEKPGAGAGPEEESSRTAELLKKARERKRQRELLEEIETEESEAAPEELETIGREQQQKRETGEAPEEEGEKASVSDRLEKLRRKREELAALEREEEQEAQGEHLHTVQAEQARGMNVWDTDEEAIAADEEAKRLKKLKKDKAEKEAAEKPKREDGEDDDFFAELAAEEREGKKKKQAAGTQAEGLEEAFAEDGEDSPAAKAEEPADDPLTGEAPRESVSDRLARLRKARDERSGPAEGAEAEPQEELSSEKDRIEAARGEADPLAGPEQQKKDKAASAGAAEGEDLFATAERREDREEPALDLAKPEKKPEVAPESAEELLAKKSKTSESMRKFLERRKQKKEAEKAEAPASGPKPTMIEEAVGPDGKRSFLAIFVAVSDSFGVASDKKMTNILRAFEGSFAHCAAFLAAPRAGGDRFKVILGNSVEPGTELPAGNSHVEDVCADSGQVVAHFVIRMSEPRTELAKDEAEAVQRAMLTLRPLASQWLLARGEKAA